MFWGFKRQGLRREKAVIDNTSEAGLLGVLVTGPNGISQPIEIAGVTLILFPVIVS